MRARRRRGTPSTAVNSPAMYQPPEPSGATAFTLPATLGNDAAAAPVPASSGTALPVAGPT